MDAVYFFGQDQRREVPVLVIKKKNIKKKFMFYSPKSLMVCNYLTGPINL